MRQFQNFLSFFAIFSAICLFAGNQQAAEYFASGREKEQKGDFKAAVKDYKEAEVQADDPVMKANSITAAARCCRKNKLYGEEFDCLEKLIKGHFTRIPVAEIVQREYEIGDAFYAGHCDSIVDWLPFLKDDSRTEEIYEAALKNGPCSPKAAEVRLKLARIYIDDQKGESAIKHLTELIKLHPDSPEAKMAALELANVLIQQSERGDGDGKHAKEALDALERFAEKHPNATENGWVQRSRQKILTNLARRNRKLGDFYRDHGKPEIASRYYANVIRDYPDTEETSIAEKRLASLDKSYKASGKEWTPEQRKFKYQSFPKEKSPIIVLPSESDERWLLPIRDLKTGEIPPTQEKIEEVTDDSL